MKVTTRMVAGSIGRKNAASSLSVRAKEVVAGVRRHLLRSAPPHI